MWGHTDPAFLLFNFEGASSSGKREEGTLIWGCSSAGRAPALQAGGHGFESHHLHQWRKPHPRKELERHDIGS